MLVSEEAAQEIKQLLPDLVATTFDTGATISCLKVGSPINALCIHLPVIL